MGPGRGVKPEPTHLIFQDFGSVASACLSGFLVAMSPLEDRLFLIDFDA
jgi:hypothetical protein